VRITLFNVTIRLNRKCCLRCARKFLAKGFHEKSEETDGRSVQSRGRRIVKKDEYRILRISVNTNTKYRIPNRRIANTEYQILLLLRFTFKIIFNRSSHLSSFSLHFLWIKLKILSLKQNIGFFHQNLKSFIIKIKDFSS